MSDPFWIVIAVFLGVLIAIMIRQGEICTRPDHDEFVHDEDREEFD